mmetsp:Transcript_10254/g.15056  ORF Transcript_10254/g.15056 Transcript_10254/m.15056 type:complete len:533 (-) Transcript_10254:1255-2853(-)
MRHLCVRISVALIARLCVNGVDLPPSEYPVDEHIFESVIDHFNFRPTAVPTFPLRYYVNEKNWNSSFSPCFFYTGNEADIFQFINNTGFLFEAAEEFGALVVFAEHRYYGLSNPFGNAYALGVPYNISFLTVEQAMEDFNTLNLHIRKKWSMTQQTPFITFGGSYGGNLALWLRLKNPNLWAGAIASSATPLKHLLRETNDFARIETEAYGNVSEKCPELVRKGWEELYEGAKTVSGRVNVAKSLSLCSPLPDERAADDVHGWISGALETMVQYGYPYETSFYNLIPGYPFRVTCQKMLKANTGLGALLSAADVYYNYTGEAGGCFDFDALVMVESSKYWKRKGDYDRLQDQENRIKNRYKKNSPKLIRKSFDSRMSKLKWEESNMAWGYQTCTEVYQPMPTNGVTDFELPYKPNRTAYFTECKRRWGVEPRPDWEEMTFMGADIGKGTSGQLDPWRAAGIQSTPKGSDGTIIVRIIESAAHHLDLRAAHPLDPWSVVSVRREQKKVMRKWITEWRESHNLLTRTFNSLDSS